MSRSTLGRIKYTVHLTRGYIKQEGNKMFYVHWSGSKRILSVKQNHGAKHQGGTLAATLTLSVPGRHGDDPVDSSFSHGADHGAHGLGVSRHGEEHGGGEAETGHDHVLPFEMSLQAVCRENVSFHHLEAADGKLFYRFLYVNLWLKTSFCLGDERTRICYQTK